MNFAAIAATALNFLAKFHGSHTEENTATATFHQAAVLLSKQL